MKVCNKCKEEKELVEFYKNNNAKDGYCNKCKTCKKAYDQANRDKTRVHSRKSHKKNFEKIKKYRAEYYKGYYKADKPYAYIARCDDKFYYGSSSLKWKHRLKRHKDSLNSPLRNYSAIEVELIEFDTIEEARVYEKTLINNNTDSNCLNKLGNRIPKELE